MIESLRNFVTSWVAKTLLALLVLSFLFFGVGDQLFFGAGPGDVAEVGEESITATEYRREFQAILNRSGVDAERGFVSGWHLITLNTLARQKALAQETRRLGFEASDAAVAETIRGGFQNIRGEFDETLYRRALAESGLRPKDYQDYVRQEMSSNLLAQAVAAGVAAPRTAAEAIWRRRNEKRDIEYVVLTGAQVPEETAPDDAALRAYYEERIDRFQTPESRRFRFLWLRPEDIADPASVSDEEVARAYEARRAEFQPPAQRFVDQLFIDDQAEAEAAAARIADGQPFARILEDRGLSLSEVSLGLQTEEQMGRFFPELAEAVFSAELARDAGGAVLETVVGPVETQAGFALVRISGEQLGARRSLAEVSDALRLELAVGAVGPRLADAANAVDELRAAGSSFEQIAASEGLTIGAATIDSARDGAGADALPPDPELVARLFAMEPGDAMDLALLPNGGYYAMALEEVIEAAPRPFAEARPDVLESWRRDRRVAALEELAARTLETARAGGPLAAAGAEARLAEDVTLASAHPDLPAQAIAGAFETRGPEAAGEVRALALDGGARRLITRVAAVSEADPAEGAAQIAALAEDARRGVASDLLGLYADATLEEIGFAPAGEDVLRAALAPPQQHGGVPVGGPGF